MALKKLTPAMYREVRRAKAFGFRHSAIMKDYGITRHQLQTILSSKPTRQHANSVSDLLAEGYTPEEIARHFGK